MSSNLNPSRRRALWIGAGAVGLAGAGVLAWTLSSRRTDAIRIGVGQPLSGDLAALGKDMLHGAQLAAESINAEGGVRVGNRSLPIEIVAEFGTWRKISSQQSNTAGVIFSGLLKQA